MTLEELLADNGRPLVAWALRDMPYSEYLLTNHWQQVREMVLRAARWKCRLCEGRAWEAHHLSYKRRGEEEPGDVVALCGPCHRIWHETWTMRVRAEGEQQFGAATQYRELQ